MPKESNDQLFSELLLYLQGSACPDFAALLTAAENAMDDPDHAKRVFDTCMDLAGDIALLDGRIGEGPWAYGLHGFDEKYKKFEFTKLHRDENGFALSFCYEYDVLVLERFFYKEG